MESTISARRVVQLAVGEFRASPWRTARAMARGKRIIVGRRFRVRGLDHINVNRGLLMLGTNFYGFADTHLGGLIRVRGRLEIDGIVTLAQGNRWDIGPGAVVAIGDRSYFSPMVKVLIFSGLTIGKDCAIAWDCQFLDDDQHLLTIPGVEPPPSSAPITIGDHVWIASRATILKGTRIGDGCVVASGSTVRGDFSEPACLLGGTPAKVIRRGIVWGDEAL
jgi:acetyltransferase-like isoleucine patch superfamily enzyme